MIRNIFPPPRLTAPAVNAWATPVVVMADIMMPKGRNIPVVVVISLPTIARARTNLPGVIIVLRLEKERRSKSADA